MYENVREMAPGSKIPGMSKPKHHLKPTPHPNHACFSETSAVKEEDETFW